MKISYDPKVSSFQLSTFQAENNPILFQCYQLCFSASERDSDERKSQQNLKLCTKSFLFCLVFALLVLQ